MNFISAMSERTINRCSVSYLIFFLSLLSMLTSSWSLRFSYLDDNGMDVHLSSTVCYCNSTMNDSFSGEIEDIERLECSYTFNNHIGMMGYRSFRHFRLFTSSPNAEKCMENEDIVDAINAAQLSCSSGDQTYFTFEVFENELVIVFCEFKCYINGEDEEIIVLSNGTCPGQTEVCNANDGQDYCPVFEDADVISTLSTPQSNTTILLPILPTTSNVTLSTLSTNTTKVPESLYIAVGVGAGSIVIFIIAIIIVIIYCKRMSYALSTKNSDNKELGETTLPDMVENTAYAGVQNGGTNSTIPVYAKPNKGNRQPNSSTDASGYEKAPTAKPRDSGYEEATLSPIQRLHDNYETEPPATPSRPRSAVRTSTPASGYEEANLKTPRVDSTGYEEATLPGDNFKTPRADYSTGYEDNFVTPATGLTNTSSGYEDNFVTPRESSGYEDNFVTPQSKESVKYDHLKRKIDLDETNESDSNLNVEGYGQIRKQSELVDAEEYQHLSHDKNPSSAEPGYGKLKKDKKPKT